MKGRYIHTTDRYRIIAPALPAQIKGRALLTEGRKCSYRK